MLQGPRQAAAAASPTKDFWILHLWCVYLLLKPFYFFDSGLPQVADFLIAALVGTLVVTRQAKISPAATRILRAQGAMVCYFACVNVIWAAYSGEFEMLLYAAYYVFNFLGCLLFASLYGRFGDRLITWTGWAVFGSVVLQAFLTTEVLGRHESRATIYFNNPNQLGYYCVLFGSLFWVWTERRAKGLFSRMFVESVFYGSAVYLACLTLSRAAIGALGVLLLMRLLMKNRLTTVLLVISGLAAVYAMDLAVVAELQQRIETKDMGAEGELFHRGYDRLVDESQHLFVGAGEGGKSRFWQNYDIELHSSMGTVLFCYGIIGLGLFLRVYWTVGRMAGWTSLIYLVPAFAYGVTHNGLRQLEFWLLMLIVGILFHRSPNQQVTIKPLVARRPLPEPAA